jgi:hypothetical protein
MANRLGPKGEQSVQAADRYEQITIHDDGHSVLKILQREVENSHHIELVLSRADKLGQWQPEKHGNALACLLNADRQHARFRFQIECKGPNALHSIHAFFGEGAECGNRPMAAKGDFNGRTEPAHPEIGRRRRRRKNECGLRYGHFARDQLHLFRREPGGSKQDTGRVSGQRGVGKSIDLFDADVHSGIPGILSGGAQSNRHQCGALFYVVENFILNEKWFGDYCCRVRIRDVRIGNRGIVSAIHNQG